MRSIQVTKHNRAKRTYRPRSALCMEVSNPTVRRSALGDHHFISRTTAPHVSKILHNSNRSGCHEHCVQQRLFLLRFVAPFGFGVAILTTTTRFVSYSGGDPKQLFGKMRLEFISTIQITLHETIFDHVCNELFHALQVFYTIVAPLKKCHYTP